MTMLIADLFLAFLVYGFIGWFYESTIWAICEQGRFTNRGFMIGPICPIYGVVSLMDWYLLHEIDSSIKIFLIAFLVCSALEYLTSWLLEKIFKARWWDYSNYPFNLNGRISLYSSILFGLAGLLLVKVLHPSVMKSLAYITPNTRILISIICAIIFVVDFIITITSLNQLNHKIEKMYQAALERCNKPFDYLNEHRKELSENVIIKKSRGILMTIENLNIKLIHIELRFLSAFPSFRSLKYDELIKQIRKKIQEGTDDDPNN